MEEAINKYEVSMGRKLGGMSGGLFSPVLFVRGEEANEKALKCSLFG